MPRVAKEKDDINNSKPVSTKKKTTTKTATKKTTKTVKKTTSKASTTAKSSTTRTSKKATSTTSTTAKTKSTTKKTVAKVPKKSLKKVSSSSIEFHSEHYDLPPTYNKTFISLLAQSPKTLFVFWDISDADKEGLIEKYGSLFFENTQPILSILNKTTNTYFEIEINDYAKNWYIDVDDSNCEFEIQLGRRPLYNLVQDDFILIATSNNLQAPNDHILLENLPETISFINVKTNELSYEKTSNLSFDKIYNIYNNYSKLYKNNPHDNPSSHN